MPFCSLLPKSTSLMLSGRFSRKVLLILSSSSFGTLMCSDIVDQFLLKSAFLGPLFSNFVKLEVER